ncbi:MAG: adenylyltransferase/cytidyltransferase family protein [Candidatus Norongarragalinales archaeon]
MRCRRAVNQKKSLRVLVFGCFDLLHLGHVFFFQRAKKLGGFNAKLFVVVARDANARRAKGKTPFFTEKERAALLRSLRVVDRVVLGGKRDLFAVIKKIKPGVIVLGFDQRVDEKKLKRKIKEFGLRARVVRLRVAFKPRRHKSALLAKRLGL